MKKIFYFNLPMGHLLFLMFLWAMPMLMVNQ